MMQMEKLPTGIGGFDQVARGGIPKHRTTLVAGTAGSAKTVFAAQFLVEGVRRGEPGVFVTFEESAADIRRNMAGFGWDIGKWEAEGRWSFVDASPSAADSATEAGGWEMGGLLARIEHAVQAIRAQRVSVDSIGALFAQFRDERTVRAELLRVAQALKALSVTSVITAERIEDYGGISRHDVEEFVADNVILLRNALDEQRRRRTVEILKFRGTTHQNGEFPFTLSSEGIAVLPLSGIRLTQRSTSTRISSGTPALDQMCGGGFFRDSIVLVSGATGTGKTLMATTFLAAGVASGERCVAFAYEESREQLFRNAHGWGIDFEQMEKAGKLRVLCEYPETASLEDHLLAIKREIDDFQPTRVTVDSLSALDRVASVRGFREFVIGLTSFIKERQVAGLFTSTTPTLQGGASVTEAHISSITDSIILLRYVELLGQMHRSLTVLKMRGSPHDKDIREMTIDSKGMHLGKAFRSVSGILAGNPVQLAPRAEIERLGAMFQDE